MTTSRYKFIEKLGLQTYTFGGQHRPMVGADELEEILAKAPRVSGKCEEHWAMSEIVNGVTHFHDTYTGILLAIEPIEKVVTKEQVENVVGKLRPDTEAYALLQQLLEHGYGGTNK